MSFSERVQQIKREVLQAGPNDSTLEERLAATEEEARYLRELAVELPEKLRVADRDGVTVFCVMIYGYEMVYYKVDEGWKVFLSDTAD